MKKEMKPEEESKKPRVASGPDGSGTADRSAPEGKDVRKMSVFLMPEADRPAVGGKSSSGGFQDKIKFDLKPEELEAYLNGYVIRQDEAKAVLATKVCTHFNRIRYLEERGLKHAPSSVGMIKNNVLLIGPTGVGKTYLVKLIAQKLGVPFVKGDATKFSETGYVGGDVEDLVRDLVYAAEDDIELASVGIIYIDEIDKIASSRSLVGPDVSRTGVQRALLKPMEETEVDLRVPHDPISQLQAIEAYRKTGKREKRTVNTRHILFIMSGAFNGLEDVIKERLKKQVIGFGAEPKKEKEFYLSQVTAQDLITYGFESEFVGRLPVVVVLEELSAEDLGAILLNPNNPVVLSKKRDFAAYGVDLRFEDEALKLIAAEASQEKTGARALVGAMERVLVGFEKTLPSTRITKLVVTPEMVRHSQAELERLLSEPEATAFISRFEAAGLNEDERLKELVRGRAREIEQGWGLSVSEDLAELILDGYGQAGMDMDRALDQVKAEVEEVRRFEDEINKEHGFKAVFDEEAVYTILRVARRADLRPREYLAGRKNELIFGLQLIRDRGGLDEFILTREAVLYTSEFVRRLVANPLPAGV